MRCRATCVLLTALLSAGAASAETPVRVYTNADLEPLPDSGEPAVAQESDDGWAFVRAHLEREQARLDAERSFDLERAAIAATERPAREERLYAFPYAPWYHGYRGPLPRKKHRRHGLPSASERVRAEHFAPIRPLHAGPSRADVMRAQAGGLRGSDAFPGR